MPRQPNPYKYQSDDSPLTLADKYGITPTQLIDANPGGYPFSTGQTINIPQFGPAMGNQGVAGPTMYGPPKPAGITGTPPVGYGPQSTPQTNYGYNVNQRGRGFGQPTPQNIYGPLGVPYAELPRPGFAAIPQLPSGAPATTTTGAGSILDPSQPYGGFQNLNGSDGTDYANTKAAQYYAAAGTPFLKQKRWDPQAKKYVSIGKLIKQGKLDLKGNWHRQSNRQRATNNAQRNRQWQQEKGQQDYTLANSLISWGVSAG